VYITDFTFYIFIRLVIPGSHARHYTLCNTSTKMGTEFLQLISTLRGC